MGLSDLSASAIPPAKLRPPRLKDSADLADPLHTRVVVSRA
jgi:hypothetical protein